jgi:hypothetical protein
MIHTVIVLLALLPADGRIRRMYQMRPDLMPYPFEHRIIV